MEHDAAASRVMRLSDTRRLSHYAPPGDACAGAELCTLVPGQTHVCCTCSGHRGPEDAVMFC